jgi:hypothetical protein
MIEVGVVAKRFARPSHELVSGLWHAAAMIETREDLGHAPSRRVYENPGYRALGAVLFVFKALYG